MPDLELKSASGQLDFKSLKEDGEFSGYAAIYGNVDQGGDIVEKGAFDESLECHKGAGTMPKMLWHHNPREVIGVYTKFESDDYGLRAEGKLLTAIPLAAQAYVLMKAKAVDGLSIGYRTVKAATDDMGNRLLKTLNLYETSVVTFPMNQLATVSDVKQLTSIRDVERLLRDAGVPANFAKLVASHGYEEAKSIIEQKQRDAAGEDEVTEEQKLLMIRIQQLKEKLNA